MTEISRSVPNNEYSEVTAAALMVYSIPWIIEDADALILFPGQGETHRVRHVIKYWESSTARYLLNAGLNTREKTAEILTIAYLREHYNLFRADGVITRVHAEHTEDQAEWTTNRIMELGDVSVAAIFAPQYHCLRAYLTLLKSFLVRKMKVALFPAPIPVSPDRISPETGLDAWDLIPGEIKRILAYQQKGDVATYEELKSYLAWLWKQPLLTQYSF